MCYGGERLPSKEEIIGIPREGDGDMAAVENLMYAVVETEARLDRARAREAALVRRLDEMRKFARVMEILETYLRRRYDEQQERLARLCSSSPSSLLVPSK